MRDMAGNPIEESRIADLERKNKSLRQHWADDDTRIKEITKSVLPDFDTDGGGYFVDMVECAEAMAARIRELEGCGPILPPEGGAG